MTAVHWSAGNQHAIPGTWLLLYGCALLTASTATTLDEHLDRPWELWKRKVGR